MDADVPIPAPHYVGNQPAVLEMNLETVWQRHIGRHQYARAVRGNIPDAASHRPASILKIDEDALITNPLS